MASSRPGNDEVFGSKAYFWPGLLDLVTSTLMIFVLVGFLQTTLNPQDLEAVLTRSKQDRFLQLFREAFAEEMKNSAISVDRHLNFLQITFSDRVLFESSEYRLQPSGELLLGRCAELLREANSTGYEQIQVEGHTDNQALNSSIYPKDNWELSTARALSVVRHLIKHGLPAKALSANGYADERPIASNSSAPHRARNRRIELRLFFAVGAPPDQHLSAHLGPT